jgi:hypothetical protein
MSRLSFDFKMLAKLEGVAKNKNCQHNDTLELAENVSP